MECFFCQSRIENENEAIQVKKPEEEVLNVCPECFSLFSLWVSSGEAEKIELNRFNTLIQKTIIGSPLSPIANDGLISIGNSDYISSTVASKYKDYIDATIMTKITNSLCGS